MLGAHGYFYHAMSRAHISINRCSAPLAFTLSIASPPRVYLSLKCRGWVTDKSVGESIVMGLFNSFHLLQKEGSLMSEA